MAIEDESLQGSGENVEGETPASEPETIDPDATVHEEEVQTLLDGVASRLKERGIDDSAIEIRIETADRPREAIAAAAADFDAVVMGESDPSIVTFVFGLRTEQLAEQFLSPVLVVQRERPEEESTEAPDDETVEEAV